MTETKDLPINDTDIAIFTTDDEQVQLNVTLQNETVWLTQEQMCQLFGKAKSTINEHVKNVFKEGELHEDSVVRKFRITASDDKSYQVNHYNLDVIISVGYRVKSQKGTQFRIWATKRLKDYLIQGYAINQQKLADNQQHFMQTLDDLKHLVETVEKNQSTLETSAILSLIQNFSETWFTLDSYDKQAFPDKGHTSDVENLLTSVEVLHSDLAKLKADLMAKGEATELFAQEKKQGALAGIYASVFQSIFGADAYPTIEEKSAHLLYFIVKNHPFNDGNKRSGAFAFIWLLKQCDYPFEAKISPQTLTTLTILIAESDPNDKDKMIGMVKLLLN